jgi:aminoglycoside/choline kinase family phosphotransferase
VTISAKKTVLKLAYSYFQTKSLDIRLLKGDGSDRQIFQIHSLDNPQSKIIGIYYDNLQENIDFLYISKKMQEASIPVPRVFLVGESKTSYLLQYLGDKNLGQCIDTWLTRSESHKVIQAYKKVLPYLISIQNKLTPLMSGFLEKRLMERKDFAEDLAYFERDFIGRFGFNKLFHENVRQELDESLLNPIAQITPSVFVYRDFQSRNIMWWKNQPWFIDYQSAFLGTRYYDLASMLYASKSGLDDKGRKILLRLFFDSAISDMAWEEFRKQFFLFVLIRRIRSLGTYGYLGTVKKKDDFLKKITPGLIELNALLENKKELSTFKQTKDMISRILKKWQHRSGMP